MEVKRIFSLAIIIVLLLVAHFFLINKYNALTVELNFKGNLTNKDFLEVKAQNDIRYYSINYKLIDKGDNVIMTTGLDWQFKRMSISQGEFINDINKDEAVIGEKIADKYFSSIDVIGKKINVLGRQFRILGIEENSNNIYIPFKEELLNKEWDKRVIKYMTNDQTRSILWLEKIQNHLKSIGIYSYDPTLYKDRIYCYLDIVIIILIYILWNYARLFFFRMKKSSIGLWQGYKEQIRLIEWNQYIVKSKLVIAKIFGFLLLDVVALFIGYNLVKHIVIPNTFVPDNIFSLTSYVDMIKYNFDGLIFHFRNGFSELLTDVSLLNISLILLIGGFYIIRFIRDTRVNSAKL